MHLKQHPVGLLSLLLLLAVATFVVSNQDSHHFNVKYLAWKRGLISYDFEVIQQYFWKDYDFQRRLEGGTFEEINHRLPLKPADTANDYQKDYFYRLPAGDFYWIGEYGRAAHFENGKLVCFRLFKG